MFRTAIARMHGFELSQENSDGNKDVMDDGHSRKPIWTWIIEALGLSFFCFLLFLTGRVVIDCLPEIWSGSMPSDFTYTLKDLLGFVLVFAAAVIIVLWIRKKSVKFHRKGIEAAGKILIAVLLLFIIFVNPFVSQPLDVFYIVTINTIPVTAVLLFFWLTVLILAAVYQTEYKAVYGRYFTGRTLRK